LFTHHDGEALAFGLALHPKRAREAEKPATTARTEPVREPQQLLIAPAVSPREHVSQFLLAVKFAPDPAGAASLRELHSRYHGWCQSAGVEQLPPAEFGRHLRSIVDAIGLECEPKGRDVLVRGAALAA
jgi:hypothetical protein